MSRSLLAAHDALRSGRLRRVSHVKGGLYGYHLAGLPIEVRSTLDKQSCCRVHAEEHVRVGGRVAHTVFDELCC